MIETTYLYCYTCKKNIAKIVGTKKKWLDGGKHTDGSYTGHDIEVRKNSGIAG